MNHKITTPLNFKSGHQMNNRFALAPLTNHQCEDDGTVTDAEVTFLQMRAEGGFGLVMTCAAQIEPSGRGQGFPGQLGVQNDRLFQDESRYRDLQSM